VGTLGDGKSDTVEYSVSTDYTSKYVFRGTTLAGSAIQPGVEASVNNFTVGGWASVAVGEESSSFADEVDIYASYNFDVSSKVNTEIGGTYYHYPESGDLFDIGANDAGTFEAYGAVSLDAPLSPSASLYYDVNLNTLTAEASLGKELFNQNRTSFGVSATAGVVEAKSGLDYQYGSIVGELSYQLTENGSVYTSANYGLSSEDTFADTNFDPADASTIDPAENSGAWVMVGIRSAF
jgi:hypothetical protein